MLVTSNRFFNDPVSKSQLSTRMDETGIRTFQVGFKFTSGSGEVIDDPSYFTFTASIGEIRNSNASSKTLTPLPITYCTFYANITEDGTTGPEAAFDVPCVSEEDMTTALPKLIGVFEDPLYLYIDIALVGCKNGGSVTCKTQQEIDDLITGGDFSIMWYNTAVKDIVGVQSDLKKVKVWRSYRYKIVPGVENSYDIYFTKSIITHTSAWPLGEDTHEETNNELTTIPTFNKFSTSKLRYHHVFLRSGYYMVNILLLTLLMMKTRENWTPQIFFDLLGSWGAFWSTLLLFFGTVALFYNSTKWHYLLRYESVVDENGVVRHVKDKDQVLYEPGESEELQLLTKQIPKLTNEKSKEAFVE